MWATSRYLRRPRCYNQPLSFCSESPQQFHLLCPFISFIYLCVSHCRFWQPARDLYPNPWHLSAARRSPRPPPLPLVEHQERPIIFDVTIVPPNTFASITAAIKAAARAAAQTSKSKVQYPSRSSPAAWNYPENPSRDLGFHFQPKAFDSLCALFPATLWFLEECTVYLGPRPYHLC